MKPRSSISFRVAFMDLSLDEVMLVLLHKDNRGFLSSECLSALRQVDDDYKKLVDGVTRLEALDFSSISLPRLDYADQKSVSPERVDLQSACFLHYHGDPGLVVRYLGNEYTGEHRDVGEILGKIHGNVDQDDYDAIERILTQGCPYEFDIEIPRSEKRKLMARGNQRSVEENEKLITKTINKEDAASHIVPLHSYLVRFSPFCATVPQGLNTKQKKERIVWDGSTQMGPNDFAINRVSSIEHEPPVTFGDTKNRVSKQMYNTRIDNPFNDVLLAYVDIKSCFRYPRFSPDVTGAFGFQVESLGLYCLSNAGVFGWIGSAAVWEPFRRAIEAMTQKYFSEFTDQDDPHGDMIDELGWDEDIGNTAAFAKAIKDKYNQGVSDSDGNPLPIPSFFFVDDAQLIAAQKYIRRLLNATIEAVFAVLGRRDDVRRHCHVALDKWAETVVSYKNTYIGLVWNTRKLTVGITPEYRDEIIELIDGPWNSTPRSFTALEMEKLIGKIARVGEACSWIYHLLPHLYTPRSTMPLHKTKSISQTSRHHFGSSWKQSS